MTTYRISDGVFFQGDLYKNKQTAIKTAKRFVKTMRTDLFVIGGDHQFPRKVYKVIPYGRR